MVFSKASFCVSPFLRCFPTEFFGFIPSQIFGSSLSYWYRGWSDIPFGYDAFSNLITLALLACWWVYPLVPSCFRLSYLIRWLGLLCASFVLRLGRRRPLSAPSPVDLCDVNVRTPGGRQSLIQSFLSSPCGLSSSSPARRIPRTATHELHQM
jgi:hypothetical protein